MFNLDVFNLMALARLSEFINNGIIIPMTIIVSFGLIIFSIMFLFDSTHKIRDGKHLNYFIGILTCLSIVIVIIEITIPKPHYFYSLAYKELVKEDKINKPEYELLKNTINSYIELSNKYNEVIKNEIENTGRPYYDIRIKM